MGSESQEFKIEDYPIGTGGDEIERRIVTATINGYESARLYWKPRITIGKDIYKKIAGIFFSDAALAEMSVEDKIPIEIAEGWPKYLAMLGMGDASLKNGQVVGEYPSSAATAETVNVFLNAVKEEENVTALKQGAFGDGIVVGYPQFVWIEKPVDHLAGQTMTVDRLPWDCTVPDVNYRKEDFSDAQVVYKVLYASKDDLLSIYPDRKAQIEEAFRFSPQLEMTSDYGITIENRDMIYSALQAATENTFKTGRVHIIERHSIIRRPMEVWTSPDSEKWQALSPDWSPERKEEWKRANPTHSSLHVESKMHWVTTITMTGQLLENRPHWFQEGRFNCECYVPMEMDGKPIGLMEFGAQNWMLSAISKTEHVHSIRLNNGNPLVTQDGAIINSDQLQSEASKPRGRIIVRRGLNVTAAITTLPSKNDHIAWRELYDESAHTNDRMLVDQNMEGGTQSSQESAKVFGSRVSQGKSKYSEALNRYNRFSLRLDNLLIKCIQILTPEHVMKQWTDPETGEEKTAEVNIPGDVNPLTGDDDPSTVSNKLDIGKYKMVMTETDNSVSGRSAELASFAEIMQAVGSTTPPEHLGVVLSKIPNRICSMIGKNIMAQQEAAAKQPQTPPPKVTVSLPLDKLPFNPQLQQAAQQLVGLQLTPQQPPAPVTGQEQAAPEPAMAPEQQVPGAPPMEAPASAPIESTMGQIVPPGDR